MAVERNFVFWLVIQTLLYVKVSSALSLSKRESTSFQTFTELTAQYGYESEQHAVTTEDGYILTLFRIGNAKNCNAPKKSSPVLLMHGLLLSADAWIDAGPTAGLAYLLADECHDLWVGNCRGNYYSRAHTSLDPDKNSAYWDFDTYEIGMYDNPAMIDYVLNATNSNQLNYIGFSQGAGTLFIMCSERPAYCDKIQSMTALAPATRMANTKSLVFRSLSSLYGKIESQLKGNGLTEVLYRGGAIQKLAHSVCSARIFHSLCDLTIQVGDHVHGLHLSSISTDTMKVMFEHFPAGTSGRNMAWYGQAVSSQALTKFDYGKQENLIKYGTETPPEYDISAVSAPVMCLYGKNDGIVDSDDVKWLLSKLPNVVESMEVEEPLWNHFDVTYSQHTAKYIFPKIKEYLSKYSDA